MTKRKADARPDALLAAIQTGETELTDPLPTYAPGWDNPPGVWSWDASRMLAGTCADDLAIVQRPEKTTRDAIGLIDAKAIGGGYLYFAAETGEWYRITDSEIEELRDLMDDDDDDTARDAYSLWCSGGTGELDKAHHDD